MPVEGKYSITGPLMAKVFEALEQYKYELPKELRDTRRYCYVKTVLGFLEIDVMSLLYLTARYVDPEAVRASDGKVEITEAVLETALRLIRRIPDYLANDLIGIGYEEFFCRHYQQPSKEKQWPEISRKLYDKKDRTGNIGLLQFLLAELGAGSLEIDDVRNAFSILFSQRGYVGEATWKLFVKSRIRRKKGPGRPRKAAYDEIYQRRTESPQPESYGNLVRQVLRSDPASQAVKLNNAKAAVSYRKKKDKSSQ